MPQTSHATHGSARYTVSSREGRAELGVRPQAVSVRTAGKLLMNDNPWQQLPSRPSFVLPRDEVIVRKFNCQASIDYRLVIDDLLPEPFLGDPTAPVILLSNNPGIGKRWKLRQDLGFMTRMRDAICCLKFTKYPFIYLDPQFHDIGGWWRQKLKCLLLKFGDEIVARSVCNVVYFPYPSRRFRHRRCELPSQEFGFGLVRTSVERGAVIVLMRKGQLRLWQEKVTGLTGYRNLIVLHNSQMPAISPKNCDPGDYEKVVQAIEEAEVKRRGAMTDSLAHLVH
jgi:hypothetical protein